MKKPKKLIAIALSMGLVFTSGMAAFANVTEGAQGDGIEQSSAVCTLDAHEHGEGCYEDGILTCTLEEHTHNALCNLDAVQGEQQGQPGQENPEMDAENSNQNQTQNPSSDGDGTGDESQPSENEPAEDHTVYVSAEQAADSEAVKGSKENPYESLTDAVNAVNSRSEKEAVIEILSDLTAVSCARINGKDVTIKGNGHRITRGDNFATISDNARSWYNPAMIEVCDSADRPNSASLRLENITLTDGGKTAGTKYSQATTDGKGGNGDTVQDAIIATYDGVGTITLGQNVTLDGYGGMSAVRLSGGTLVMESGSKITGGKNFTTKGGGNGPAGGVWIQGGNLVMNKGAEITGVSGRAVYIDGGSAIVNGIISNIKGNLNMWQGESGVAIHVRGGGYAVLGETGVIDGITGDHASYRGAVMTNGSRGEGLWDFEAKQGSTIKNITGFPAVYSNYGTELLNGLITDCTNDFIIGGFAQKTTIGETGVIEHCTAKNGAANAIAYTSNASKIFLKGTVRDNTASYAFYIINQSGGGASLEMYDGALISNTSGAGVYINASECSFTMHGGTISENGSYGVYAREKANRAAAFTMEDGRICNNGSYGVWYNTNSGKTGRVNITGGEISGNGSAQVSISSPYSEDELSRVFIKDGVVKAANDKENIINTSFGQLSNIDMGEGNTDLYLGNAKSAASQKIKDLVAEHETSGAYMTAGSALWFKPETDTLRFTTPQPSGNTNNYLWAVYIPLKADGTPEDDAELTVVKVENTSLVDVTLTDLEAGQPYALMWMQPDDSNTGAIQLTTKTPLIQEVKGQEEPYAVDYTFTYTAKNLYSSMQQGDQFTAVISLDPALTVDSIELKSTYFEQIGEAVYDENAHTVTVTFQVSKDKLYSFSSATINLHCIFDAERFQQEEKSLKANAALTGTLTIGTDVQLNTVYPCVADLSPLTRHTVTFHPNGGVMADGTQTEVTVLDGDAVEKPIADPTRGGYRFQGWYHGDTPWDFDTDVVTEDMTLTAVWRQNYVPPTVNYYTLTIHYTYEDGTQARPDVVQTLEEGSSYSVASPVIDGYTASQNVVSGTLNDNAEFTVTYTENSEIDDPNVPLDPDPGKNDPSIDDPIIDDPDVPLSPGTDLPKDDQNGNQSNKNNTNQPKTGDHAPLMAWTGVLLLSAGLLIPAFARRRKDALK